MKNPRRLLITVRYWIQDLFQFRFSLSPFRRLIGLVRFQLERLGWIVAGNHEKGMSTREVIAVDIAADEAVVRDIPSASNYLNPIFLALTTFEWIKRWFVSRPYLAMLQAVPAIALGVTLIVFLLPIPPSSRAAAVNIYRRQATAASKQGSTELKDLCLRRLCSLEPGNRDYQFERAKSLHESGEIRKAKSTMARLATEGLADAQLWLADDLFQEFESTPDTYASTKKRELLKLTSAVLKTGDPRQREAAHQMLGQIHFQDGNINEAVQHFTDVIQTNKNASYPIAKLFYRTRQFQDAVPFANSAIEIVEERIKRDPGSAELQSTFAEMKMMAEKEEDAIKGLKDASKLIPDRNFDSAISECYCVWAKRIQRQATLSADERFPTERIRRCIELLDQSLDYDPTNQLAVEQLGIFASVESEFQEAVIETVSQIVVERPSFGSHFVLGTYALVNNGPVAEAALHLEHAKQLNPNNAALWNNLAMLHLKQKKLTTSLELANKAVAAHPKNASFRETRGQVYRAVGELQKSAVDYEFALTHPDLRKAAHLALSQIYMELGNSSLAERHKKQLKSW